MGSGKRSKDTWKCKEGCANDLVACEHLEALLDREVGQGLHRNLRYMSDVSHLPNVPFDYGSRQVTEEEENLFKSKLRKAGLIEEEVTFLVDKFVNNKSMQQIAKDQGFTSKSTAGYFYRRVMKKLKGSSLFRGDS